MNSKFISFCKLSISTMVALSLLPTSGEAAPKRITGKLSRSLGSGYRLLAISDSNKSTSANLSGKSISIIPPSSNSRLYVVGPDNQVAYQVVATVCTKAKSGINKGKYTKCNNKSLVRTAIKAGADLGTLKIYSGGALLSKVNGDKYKSIANSTTTALASNYVPVGVSSNGQSTQNTISTASLNKITKLKNLIHAKADSSDSDEDGLVNALDVDDDGDGIIDNYDSSSSTPGTTSSFKVFSNLKLDIGQSLNQHTTGLNSSLIDSALQSVQTLAIQVAGASSDAVELNCGTLGYCTTGGTGKTVEGTLDFPGTEGGDIDPDSDGYGTITRGTTGDFQLKTGATSSQITAGDTYIEIVTDSSSSATNIPGMLNFVFHSTPALKSVAVNSSATQTVDYAASPILGSSTNCISAPASGDVTIALTGWRPQRPGNSEAGEGAYVDIGNSIIVADIPNGPCVGGACSSTGPGTCRSSSYTSSDSNLTVNGDDGFLDNKGDVDADSTNTYTFTLNVSNCLSSASSGAIAWNAGETLAIDLQFKSRDGDNAAQKFCIRRAAS